MVDESSTALPTGDGDSQDFVLPVDELIESDGQLADQAEVPSEANDQERASEAAISEVDQLLQDVESYNHGIDAYLNTLDPLVKNVNNMSSSLTLGTQMNELHEHFFPEISIRLNNLSKGRVKGSQLDNLKSQLVDKIRELQTKTDQMEKRLLADSINAEYISAHNGLVRLSDDDTQAVEGLHNSTQQHQIDCQRSDSDSEYTYSVNAFSVSEREAQERFAASHRVYQDNLQSRLRGFSRMLEIMVGGFPSQDRNG